jgi:hypothetical protein
MWAKKEVDKEELSFSQQFRPIFGENYRTRLNHPAQHGPQSVQFYGALGNAKLLGTPNVYSGP